jgi:hypothetical protein
MDLNPAQRKLVFAAVVLVLAGLGAFLIIQGPLGKHGNTGHGRAVGLTQPLSTPSWPRASAARSRRQAGLAPRRPRAPG